MPLAPLADLSRSVIVPVPVHRIWLVKNLTIIKKDSQFLFTHTAKDDLINPVDYDALLSNLENLTFSLIFSLQPFPQMI